MFEGPGPPGAPPAGGAGGAPCAAAASGTTAAAPAAAAPIATPMKLRRPIVSSPADGACLDLLCMSGTPRDKKTLAEARAGQHGNPRRAFILGDEVIQMRNRSAA